MKQPSNNVSINKYIHEYGCKNESVYDLNYVYELLFAVLLTIFDCFAYNRANSVIFETNKLIISLLLLMCKHVSVLQTAQQNPKVQKERKKNFLVNNVRKLTAARESWHYFFNRHSFDNSICEFQKFKQCC